MEHTDIKRNKRLLDIILSRYNCVDWFYTISITSYELKFQGHYKAETAKNITKITGKEFKTDSAGFLNLTTGKIEITLT